MKKGDEYVSEWTGEIVDEGGIGTAIGKAINEYRISSGQEIWGMTIMIDKAQSQRQNFLHSGLARLRLK